MNGDQAGIYKEAVRTYLKRYPAIRLGKLRKITKNFSQDIR
jgi:hypothetical protein